MKKIALLLLVSLLLVACNLPFTPTVSTPTEPPPLPTEAPVLPTAPPAEVTEAVPTVEPALEGTIVELEGLHMVIPPCLAATPSLELVAASPYDPNGGPMSVWPEHRRINFTGYPLAGKFFEPHVRIFPMPEYSAMYEHALNQSVELQNLLSTKPAEVAESLPLLPPFGAAQVFHVKMGYLAFQNGEGVRFLTEYAQYLAPYNNNDLFYTFQGLTTDGAYWVSAVLPINNAILPATYDSVVFPPGGMPIPSFSSPTFDADFQAYNNGMKAIMNSTADDTFTPSITCLDQFIRSLEISD